MAVPYNSPIFLWPLVKTYYFCTANTSDMDINFERRVNKRVFTWWEIFILGIVLVIAAIVFTYTVVRIVAFWPLNRDDLGTVGQFFGGLFTPIVASIGIVYLYGTYRIQLCAIETQEQQQTEQVFFHLLNQQHTLASRLTNDFATVQNDLQRRFSGKAILLREDINSAFVATFSPHAAQFEQYYRHLLLLLQYVNKHQAMASPASYSEIIQAWMSADELYVACVYGISDYGRGTLQRLMNELKLLGSLRTSDDASTRWLVETFYPTGKSQ